MTERPDNSNSPSTPDPAMDRLMQKFVEAEDAHLKRDSSTTSKARRAKFIESLRQENIVEEPTAPIIVTKPTKAIRHYWLAAALLIAIGLSTAAIISWNKPPNLYAAIVESIGDSPIVDGSPGDLRTTQGTAMIVLDKGRVQVFVASNTQLSASSDRRFTIQSGQAWFFIQPKSGAFTVETVDGRVEVVGTSYGVHVTPSGTNIDVASGRVNVVNQHGSSVIGNLQRATMQQTSAPVVTPAVGTDSVPEWAWQLLRSATEDQLKQQFPSAHFQDTNTRE